MADTCVGLDLSREDIEDGDKAAAKLNLQGVIDGRKTITVERFLSLYDQMAAELIEEWSA